MTVQVGFVPKSVSIFLNAEENILSLSITYSPVCVPYSSTFQSTGENERNMELPSDALAVVRTIEVSSDANNTIDITYSGPLLQPDK